MPLSRGLPTFYPLARQRLLSQALTSPAPDGDGTLSISTRHIVNDDLTAHEGHPMIAKDVLTSNCSGATQKEKWTRARRGSSSPTTSEIQLVA